MAKVIIKPAIHLSDKDLKYLYNLINDQYQKNDVVIVPYYCEVYVVDGADIEIQKNEQSEGNKCTSSEHQFKVNFNGKSAAEWFKHNMCTHCKHSCDDGCCGLGEPCSDFNRWEYKDE